MEVQALKCGSVFPLWFGQLRKIVLLAVLLLTRKLGKPSLLLFLTVVMVIFKSLFGIITIVVVSLFAREAFIWAIGVRTMENDNNLGRAVGFFPVWQQSSAHLVGKSAPPISIRHINEAPDKDGSDWGVRRG